MKKFFARFLNVTWILPIAQLENKKCLQVVAVNDCDNLHEALGITEERAHELSDLVEKSVRKTNRTTEAMELITKEILHANELYMAAVILNKQLEMMRNPLAGLFGEMLRDRGE